MHRSRSSWLAHTGNLLLLLGFCFTLWTVQWVSDGTFAVIAQERPRNPAERGGPSDPSERGEPTRSDKTHPQQPEGPRKPADAELAPRDTKSAPNTSQNQEERRWDWLPEGFAAWMFIPIAALVLAIIFMSLSTSPSRDPSRKPR